MEQKERSWLLACTVDISQTKDWQQSDQEKTNRVAKQLLRIVNGQDDSYDPESVTTMARYIYKRGIRIEKDNLNYPHHFTATFHTPHYAI